MIRIFLFFLFLLSFDLFPQASILSGQDTSRRPIITAVPFLLISPDSRGSAMGETGVATSPDVNSVHWNNAKLAFIDKKYGFGMSYVPWLGKIVDDMSVSYLTGFYKLDNVQTIGLSMKYFDLGEIQLTDNQGFSLGIENPKELSTAFTYSRKLTNDLSIIPLRVPHRDEYSETAAYEIIGKNKKALFIPDIDKWEKWSKNLIELVQEFDYLLLDATFYDSKEINRDISEIPHPLVSETISLLDNLTTEDKSKVYFIHMNHTNMMLDPKSDLTDYVISKGFNITRLGLKLEL